MRALPGETVTMLFSDIEGSTLMLQRLGARWGEVLTDHREILRSTFDEHGGREMGTEGDSFFIVFTSAQHAVMAAVEGQRRLLAHRWPGDQPLRVRMGLHTGEPERHGEGYIGIDVHQAARIAATACGGQVVVSAATQALAAHLDGEVGMRDLGLHRLKDLPDPVHLFEVTAPGLPDEHRALRSLGTQASLPAYATEIIGREREVVDVARLLEERGARLVTLTGTGGTGKTRLAVAVARDLQDRFPYEIFFVPLHTADRAALLWSGLAEVVGAPADAELLPHDRVLRFLADRRALLVLDNLEQIPDADDAVSRLLEGAPGLAVLATSRRPLHLPDEHLYPVAPLAVPARPSQADVEAARTGAVELFVQRARMVRPSFRLTAENLDPVVTLCRRLDGLPLAIELAAARSQLLSPRALLNRIDGRLGDRLTAGHRAQRQQTLAATIAWSYDLLDPDNQRIFRRLGVFSGRVGLDAVQSVAATDGEDPLDVIAHLVDVSLAEIVEGPDGEPMVRLLETIRRYARERLGASGEYEEVRLRHARWCLEAATEVSALLSGPRQMSALDRMEAVEEDIRSALDWCLTLKAGATERRECGLALLEPMDAYWYRFGYVAEGRGWHDRALAVLEHDASADPGRLVDALHGKGILAVQQNDLRTGAQALEKALELAHRIGDHFRESRESNSLGVARREAGDTEEARRLILRSASLAREIGDTQREAIALSNVVQIHLDAGEFGDAVAAARRAIDADRALGDPWGVAINQCNLVPALLNAEGPLAAHEQFVAAAPEAVALGDVELSVDVLDSGAAVWAALGDAVRAATLLGAADRQRELAGMPRAEPDQRHLDRFLDPAQRALGSHEWDRARARGAAMSIEDAVAEGVARPGDIRSFSGNGRVT